MKKNLILYLIIIVMISTSCSPKTSDDLVLVEGGAFVNENSNYYGSGIVLPEFYIGRYEVSQKEWTEVMGNNPSQFIDGNLPVEMVSWYDCIAYCNQKSEKEGLQPYYNIDKDNKDVYNVNIVDHVKWSVTINEDANGYRLQTDAEWEYAASGGQKSKGCLYSGSDTIDEVARYWRNSGDEYITGNWNWIAIENNNGKTGTIGIMKPNELGLYEMSGNVREWCWDWFDGYTEPEEMGEYDVSTRICRGGGWIGDEKPCQLPYRGRFEASGLGPDQGFRICRNA